MTDPRGPARQPRAADWFSVEDARQTILDQVAVLGTEQVSVLDALGRVLATDIDSTLAHPAWDNSAMDGYAVRDEDVLNASPERPVVLRVVEDVPAGAFPTRELGPGEAIKVMTGAPVPEGAQGVTRVEYTEPGPDPDTIRVLDGSDAGRNIRRAGEDVKVGDRALEAGTRLGPAEVGVLAMVGRPVVRVYRRPRIGVLATGDELADFDELGAAITGQRIMNSNSYAVAAQVLEAGGVPELLGIARDDRESLRSHLQDARGGDALITSAGLAVGEHDYVKDVLDEMGMEFLFYRVSMRPGSPFTFGTLDGMPVFALPGNPVSSMVTFEVLVRPALQKMIGRAVLERPRIRVRLAEAITSKMGLTHFNRVVLESDADGLPRARLTGPQGSGILSSMTAADALIIVPPDSDELPAGAELEAIPLK